MMRERTNKCTCIYKIESLCKPEMFYIGSAFNFQSRKLKHLSSLRRNCHVNPHLQNHFNKYGEPDLVFTILEEVTCKEILIQREQSYIDSLQPSFNFCKIAGNCAGRIHSDSTKRKIKGSLIGVKHTEERKKNLRESHRHEFKAVRILKNEQEILAESITEAARIVGTVKQNVMYAIKHGNFHKGYKFELIHGR